MALWFECRIRYDRMKENGIVAKVNEPYLVDALTFSEAESRIVEKVTPLISGEFSVSVARKTKISEIFNLGADRYYLVKVGFIQLDEKTGAEKRAITHILVGANDFDEALLIFKAGMNGTLASHEVVSISETPILEVFPAKVG